MTSLNLQAEIKRTEYGDYVLIINGNELAYSTSISKLLNLLGEHLGDQSAIITVEN